MHKVLVVGAGRIGTLINNLLGKSSYQVYLADKEPQEDKSIINLNIEDLDSVKKFLQKNPIETIISCVPYYHTIAVANMAKNYQLNYFDLTEDLEVSKKLKMLASNFSKVFVPQCGLAPGLVGIVANNLLQHFSEIDSIRLRVGGMPQFANNALHYAITWSVDGLINQYGNPCHGIENNKFVILKPLEDIEEIEIDGQLYEAFNTSGGLGNLATIYQNAREMNYKTIRYPGHCEKMRFLMNDLKLNSSRKILKQILENAIPITDQDVVILYVAVTGKREGRWHEETFVKKYYPQKIDDKIYSALQLTTAASACAVIDLILNSKTPYQGLVYQEQINLLEFMKNPFANYLDKSTVKSV